MAKTAENTRLYELTYLLPVSLTDSEAAKIKDSVVALVKKYKGEVVESPEWGKRRLAYRLKHGGATHVEAFYVHHVLKFEPTQAPAFEKEVYLQTGIMRHLMVSAEEKKAAPAPADEAKGAQVEATA
jgi:small subunit ribosomal protein S6